MKKTLTALLLTFSIIGLAPTADAASISISDPFRFCHLEADGTYTETVWPVGNWFMGHGAHAGDIWAGAVVVYEDSGEEIHAQGDQAVLANGCKPVVTEPPTIGTTPARPAIGVAVSGIAGGAITATANWPEATDTGGLPITGYRVRALRLAADGTVLSKTSSPLLPALARALEMTLPVDNANYRFRLQAFNAIGGSRQSLRSNLVVGR